MGKKEIWLEINPYESTLMLKIKNIRILSKRKEYKVGLLEQG